MNNNRSFLKCTVGLAIALASGVAPAACPYAISVPPTEAVENSYMTFNVFRVGDPSTKVTIQYHLSGATPQGLGSATQGLDYDYIGYQTLTFNPNEVMKTVSVWIRPDTSVEGPEVLQLYYLDLAGDGITTSGPGKGVIIDSN